MPRLRCSDHGFGCGFESEGDYREVIEEFGAHARREHGIDYPDGVLMRLIMIRQARDRA